MHVVQSRSSGVGAKSLRAFLQPVCCSESEQVIPLVFLVIGSGVNSGSIFPHMRV